MDRHQLSDQAVSMEERLKALAPRDVSDHAMDCYDETIDQFFEGVDETSLGIIESYPIPKNRSGRWLWTSAAVLVVGVGGLLSGLWTINDPSLRVVGDANSPSAFGTDGDVYEAEVSTFTFVKSVNWVEGHQDDGVIIPSDGGAPHYRHRYQIVDEEQMRDEVTGAIVTVRRPRQEVITVPVTHF